MNTAKKRGRPPTYSDAGVRRHNAVGYLTAVENEALDQFVAAHESTRSEVVRAAVLAYLAQHNQAEV